MGDVILYILVIIFMFRILKDPFTPTDHYHDR